MDDRERYHPSGKKREEAEQSRKAGKDRRA